MTRLTLEEMKSGMTVWGVWDQHKIVPFRTQEDALKFWEEDEHRVFGGKYVLQGEPVQFRKEGVRIEMNNTGA